MSDQPTAIRNPSPAKPCPDQTRQQQIPRCARDDKFAVSALIGRQDIVVEVLRPQAKRSQDDN
jgi:hypothetical protein